MRHTFKEKPTCGLGDTRFIVRFLWIPRKIGLEVRWLEVVTIKQKMVTKIDTSIGWPLPYLAWEDIKFVNK